MKKLDKWLTRINQKKQLGVILGSSVNGLSFIRSLSRKNVPTLLIDSKKDFGNYSRFGKNLMLPQVEENSNLWMEQLTSIGKRLHFPIVLFATSDVHTLFIAKHAKDLSKYYNFLVPQIEDLEKIISKKSQYEIAKNLHVSCPKTWFPEFVEDIQLFSKDLQYPCILKPYVTYIGRKKIKDKVVLTNSYEDLCNKFSQLHTASDQFMIQEVIPGEDHNILTYLAFWDDASHEVCWLTKRKLRQFPPSGFGDGSIQETCEIPQIRELSHSLLKKFNYRGFVGIEFIYDDNKDEYFFIEVNPRTEMANQLAIDAGIDFPWIGYNYLTKKSLSSVSLGPFKSNIKFINEHIDVKTFFYKKKEGSVTIRSWIKSLKNIDSKAIFAWDDLLPFIIMSLRIFASSFKKVLSGIFNVKRI